MEASLSEEICSVRSQTGGAQGLWKGPCATVGKEERLGLMVESVWGERVRSSQRVPLQPWVMAQRGRERDVQCTRWYVRAPRNSSCTSLAIKLLGASWTQRC